MVQIGDMRERAEAFAVSARFKAIASALEKTLQGQSLEASLKEVYCPDENLNWIASLVGEVNRKSFYPQHNPKLICLATSLKPLFIQQAISYKFPLSLYDKASEYFSRKRELKPEQLSTVQKALDNISNGILGSLNVASGSYAF